VYDISNKTIECHCNRTGHFGVCLELLFSYGRESVIVDIALDEENGQERYQQKEEEFGLNTAISFAGRFHGSFNRVRLLAGRAIPQSQDGAFLGLAGREDSFKYY
jgi:hypothetical protein